MKALLFLLFAASTQSFAYVPNPYRSCVSDSYVTFNMEWCSGNLQKSSPVTEVCRGRATAFGITYPVVQITTAVGEGELRTECLFTFDKSARTNTVEGCSLASTKYYVSAYGKLLRTEITECLTEQKSLILLNGRSTSGDGFSAAP